MGSLLRISLSIALFIFISSLLLSVLVVAASVPDVAISLPFEPVISEPGIKLELVLELEVEVKDLARAAQSGL